MGFAGESESGSDSDSDSKGAAETETGPEAEAETRTRFGMVKVGHVYEVRGGVRARGACAAGARAHTWAAGAADVLQGRVCWDAAGTVRLEARRSGLCVVRGAARCARCGAVQRVAVEAKIMAANKGTPSLRDGVHCVGTCRTPHGSSSGSESESGSSSDSD